MTTNFVDYGSVRLRIHRGRLLNRADSVPQNAQMQEAVCEQQGLTVDAAGRYIYDIVRGPNVVTVFEIEPGTGEVKPVQHQPIDGKWPRGCALSPDGRFLVVCCLGSEKLVVFSVGENGRLTPTGYEYPNAAAAYATFCQV